MDRWVKHFCLIVTGISGISLSAAASDVHRTEVDRGDNYMSDRVAPSRRTPVIDKRNVDPKMLEAAQGMEAMFIDYMMQSMRKTVPDNDMNLENAATKVYRSMLDTEFAQKAAKQGGVGLADQIIAYLDSTSYNLRRPSRGLEQRTGGTNESSSIQRSSK